MKNLGLDELLRYVLAGGVFLGTFGLAVLPYASFAKLDLNAESISIGLGLILLVGVLLYSLHRALVYPVVLRGIYACLCKLLPKPLDGRRLWRRIITWMIPWTIPQWEQELNRLRWSRRAEMRRLYKPIERWSSQVHFLYLSAWAVFFALLNAWPWPRQTPGFPRNSLLVWGVVFLAGAVIDDLRVTLMELKARDWASPASPSQSRSDNGHRSKGTDGLGGLGAGASSGQGEGQRSKERGGQGQ